MIATTFKHLLDDLRGHAGFHWLRPGELCAVHLGPTSAAERVWWDVSTHGQECAPALALARFVREYGEEWPWPNVALVAVIADAQGLDELGYGFVGVDASRACWPPLWHYHQDDGRYWTFVDNNSAWGNMAEPHLPEVHRLLRQHMAWWHPTFVYASHETVNNEWSRHPFWTGCGLMVIETYPIAEALWPQLVGIPGPLEDPLGFIAYLFGRWGWALLHIPRWRRCAKLLAKTPGYRIVSRIMERYTGPVMGVDWMRHIEAGGEISVGPGRFLHAPRMQRADWLTLTDYAVRHFGAVGVTTETFPPGELGVVGLDSRAEQTFLFARAVVEALDGS
ncbi:MAG TPA: hypothetical protein EYP49_16925 [Anaerolineae bacterium]|nr:hypothetical protein [Anaerolineae bacterium]